MNSCYCSILFVNCSFMIDNRSLMFRKCFHYSMFFVKFHWCLDMFPIIFALFPVIFGPPRYVLRVPDYYSCCSQFFLNLFTDIFGLVPNYVGLVPSYPWTWSQLFPACSQLQDSSDTRVKPKPNQQAHIYKHLCTTGRRKLSPPKVMYDRSL